jgi:hypothetical protein
MISNFTMRQYDEHLQERRRSYLDAQYDGQLLINLPRQVWKTATWLFSPLRPGATPQLSALGDCMEPNGFTDALQNGLTRGVGPC